MRYPFVAFIGFTIFTFLVDFMLYKHLNKLYPKKQKTHFTFPTGDFWYYAGVLFFTVAFFIAWLFVVYANSPGDYTIFMRLLMLYLLIYVPKLFYLLVYGLASFVVGIFDKFKMKKEPKKLNEGRYPRMSRKKFLSQVGIVMASAPFISLMFGVLKGRFAFDITRTRIPLRNLPKAFNGLKIVQISDIHLGSFNSNHKQIEKVVEMINGEKPDIICFTGDLVNNFYEETIGWDSIFNRLEAPFGKFSILGNHDYGNYSRWKSPEEKAANFEGIKNAHARFGFKLLKNESVIVTHKDEQIALVGVENWGHPPFPKYGDLNVAEKDVRNIPFKILLTHDPDHWDAEVLKKKPYSLTLSGHTHGMQFGLRYKKFQWSPAQYKFRRWAGLYQANNQYLYVNRGLGYLGMPARVGMPPEITVLELYSQA
jgi:predicted MPP superfamily phosphohydrolase